jgi:hypothetical protein
MDERLVVSLTLTAVGTDGFFTHCPLNYVMGRENFTAFENALMATLTQLGDQSIQKAQATASAG